MTSSCGTCAIKTSPRAFWGWPRLSALAAVLSALLCVAAAPQQYKLIAHPQVTVTSLTRAELSQLFMKKVTKWRDGSRAVPVDQPVSSEVRESFSHDVHGKGAAAVDAYWQKQIFSGREVPPVTKANNEVAAYVRANPGAVGYVSAGTDTSGVKVLEVQ